MNYNRIMNKLLCLLAIAICVLSVSEVPVTHRKRTPQETAMFIHYMNRSPIMERVMQVMSRMFPSRLTPNIYAYPEVKITNYLDAQYYG